MFDKIMERISVGNLSRDGRVRKGIVYWSLYGLVSIMIGEGTSGRVIKENKRLGLRIEKGRALLLDIFLQGCINNNKNRRYSKGEKVNCTFRTYIYLGAGFF